MQLCKLKHGGVVSEKKKILSAFKAELTIKDHQQWIKAWVRASETSPSSTKSTAAHLGLPSLSVQ